MNEPEFLEHCGLPYAQAERFIAEWMGICIHENTERYCVEDGNSVDTGYTCLDCGKDTYGFKEPKYATDLNAMAAVEVKISDDADIDSRYMERLEKWACAEYLKKGVPGLPDFSRIIGRFLLYAPANVRLCAAVMAIRGE